jgi:hypothetical protein
MSATSLKITVPSDEIQIRKLIQSVELAYGEKQNPPNRLLPPAELRWKSLDVVVSGDSACCTGFLRVARKATGKNVQMDRAASRWRCAIIELERIRGEWRIVHARFRAISAPAGLATPVLRPSPTPGALPSAPFPSPAPWPAPCVPAFDLQP